MNCEEYREKIKLGLDATEEMLEHKSSCKDCEIWLRFELETPPEGVSKEQWDKTTSGINPGEVEKIQTEKEKLEENPSKTLMGYYLNGLKYGVVLGLAIVVGLAIVDAMK